jgi:hypothetical protein
MSPFVSKAAMDSAFMSCHTMPQLLKLLFEFNPNFSRNSFPNFWLFSNKWECDPSPWVMMQEYRPNFLPTLEIFKS